MRIDTVTSSNGNYSATIEVVSVDLGGLESASRPKLRLLLDFGEHAREFISSEVGLQLLLALSSEERLRARLAAASHWPEARVQELLRLLKCCVSFRVIPMENHGGRVLVDQGDLCERKNGEKVDPNRNWGVDWGLKEKDYDAGEEAPGAFAFSEPETQIVRDLAKAYKPHVWLNVHSGMSGLFMPYDHVAKVASGPANDYTLQMLNTLNTMALGGKCTVGSGGASVGYLAHGTATDYMMDALHVPVPLTWEIYGDLNAHYKDCFRMFNPLTREQFDETLQLWTTAILDTVLLMVSHPAESVAALGLAHMVAVPPVGAPPAGGGGELGVRVPTPVKVKLAPAALARGGAVHGAAHVAPKVTAARQRREEEIGPWNALPRNFAASRMNYAAGGLACSCAALVLWALLRRCSGAGRRKRRMFNPLPREA